VRSCPNPHWPLGPEHISTTIFWFHQLNNEAMDQRSNLGRSNLGLFYREVPKSKKQVARELEEKKLIGLQKSAKRDMFSDEREEKEKDTMDDWDQAKLEEASSTSPASVLPTVHSHAHLCSQALSSVVSCSLLFFSVMRCCRRSIAYRVFDDLGVDDRCRW
jgi:hypothetical protein